MPIRGPQDVTNNIVNIFQVALSTQFTEQQFTVVNELIKTYSVENNIESGTDVVLLNGLFQIKGANESYVVDINSITFNPTTVLTVGDNITIYYNKQI